MSYVMGLAAAKLNFFLVPNLYLGTHYGPKLGLGDPGGRRNQKIYAPIPAKPRFAPIKFPSPAWEPVKHILMERQKSY